MISITDKISTFFNKWHKLDSWIRNTSITEALFSHVAYLNQQIKRQFVKPPMIIFDIDDTLLDTNKFLKKFPMMDGIEPSITFLQYAQSIGYHIVILSARKEEKREQTIENLKKVGVKDYDQLILRSEVDLKNTISNYKLIKRKELNSMYTIIANVGDQISDFEGGHNGKIIKIPNF
jgi:predicted secreted acid phosphatase